MDLDSSLILSARDEPRLIQHSDRTKYVQVVVEGGDWKEEEDLLQCNVYVTSSGRQGIRGLGLTLSRCGLSTFPFRYAS